MLGEAEGLRRGNFELVEGETGTSNNLEESWARPLRSLSSIGLPGALFVTVPFSKAAIRERREVEGGIFSCKPPRRHPPSRLEQAFEFRARPHEVRLQGTAP
jgi:hypothetical protein